MESRGTEDAVKRCALGTGAATSKDGRVVETSIAMAYAFASNSNAQLLGAQESQIAVIKYVVGYCTKNPVQLANTLTLIRQVEAEVDDPSIARSTDGADQSRMLKRLINAIDRKVEVSGQMAAMSLLGYPSWHASHKFVVVNPWHYVASLPALFPERDGFDEYEGLDPSIETNSEYLNFPV